MNFSPAAAVVASGKGVCENAALPQVSVVIPVYRGENVLRALHQRLTQTLQKLGFSYEIIFVEDASPDNAWSVLEAIAADDKKYVRAIKLSRNYGQQAAITAGLAHARGQRFAVVMDCDLQDPPEFIPDLFAKAQEGFDIVWARRVTRVHNPLRALCSKIYFDLLSALTNAKIDNSTGAFTIITRPVIDAYLRFSDFNRHYKLILLWLGFRHGYVDYDHSARQAEGKSSYNFKSLVKVAMQGLFFQSTVLLEWIVSAGFCISAAGVVLSVAAIVAFFFCKTILPGWTSIVVLLLLLGGFNLVAIGMVGLYVGQIFEQVKGRPLFVVARSLNDPDEHS